jgi:hypothetical protein
MFVVEMLVRLFWNISTVTVTYIERTASLWINFMIFSGLNLCNFRIFHAFLIIYVSNRTKIIILKTHFIQDQLISYTNIQKKNIYFNNKFCNKMLTRFVMLVSLTCTLNTQYQRHISSYHITLSPRYCYTFSITNGMRMCGKVLRLIYFPTS